jgi:hypothetical protein
MRTATRAHFPQVASVAVATKRHSVNELNAPLLAQARSLAHNHSAAASIKALEPKSRPDEPALPVGAAT